VTAAKAGLIERRVAMACVFALIALGLIVWSLVDPAPLPVIGAMTVGQIIGTLSLLFFFFAIVADLRTAAVEVAPGPPDAPESHPPST
jgi:polyferredoxin